jgi:hypothetical protein
MDEYVLYLISVLGHTKITPDQNDGRDFVSLLLGIDIEYLDL